MGMSVESKPGGLENWVVASWTWSGGWVGSQSLCSFSDTWDSEQHNPWDSVGDSRKQ